MTSYEAGEAKARELRALLLPAEEHPARDLIDLEFSFQQLRTEPLPVPWGMVWEPEACENYIERAIPDIDRISGWMRSTDRRSRSFRHNNFYIDSVFEIPGGADVDRIWEAASECRSGRLTLDYKVTGRVSYSRADEPSLRSLRDAQTLAMDIQVEFDAPRDSEAAETLRKYRYVEGDGGPVVNRKQVVYVGTEDKLFMVLSPQPQLAQQMAATLHRRARGQV